MYSYDRRVAHETRMTPEDYKKYDRNRQDIIRQNSSRRMRKQEPLPVPPKVDPPVKIQMHTKGGDYIGTWAFGISKEEAIEEAIEKGAIQSPHEAVIKLVPA